MLAMTSVIVDYTFKNVFLFLTFQLFILDRWGLLNAGPRVTYPLLSLSSGLGALITC